MKQEDFQEQNVNSSAHWNNAGPGWGSLHNAVVEECNSVRSTKLKANNGRDEYHSRHELWEDFKQFQQNVRNSTNDTDDGRTFRLLFFKFLSLKTKVENGERKIEDIIKSSKDESTNYKNQAIIVLQQDRTVQTAAINLYYKHPEVSTIYLYDKKTKKYTLVAGKEQSFGKNSRIQIVGHAGDKSGEMLFSKLNGEELARAVSAIPGIKNNKRPFLREKV
ncbi:hypothetical protein KUTeg_005587 [Tegillarca granosa]|uniref:Peptidase C80 domain-containing protein n=1 Tax=Tegillarca granosa TaxID=220873 RepID=A0ABQ9FPP7_TEGGR|nr:hypothetical protein KUTeg_005587 [Tegillarca granosa]